MAGTEAKFLDTYNFDNLLRSETQSINSRRDAFGFEQVSAVDNPQLGQVIWDFRTTSVI